MPTSTPDAIRVPRQVVPLTAQELALFDARLGNAQPALEAWLLALRLDVDATLAPALPFYGEKPYPLGRCLEIRDAVFEQLAEAVNGRLEVAVDHAATLQRLRRYLAEGGICQKVWGSLRRVYFQNALQLGPWYVDVANDTVVITKPKIEVLPMATSGFANIEDYLHFADVARAYWHVEIYANTVFPKLAPLFPLVCVNAKGSAWLAAGYEELVALTRREDFLPSELALTRLPPPPAAVHAWFAARVTPGDPLHSRDGDPIDACRAARAQGLQHSRDYRQALVAAYRSLPLR